MLEDLITRYKTLSKQIKILILIVFSAGAGYYSYMENWEVKELDLENLKASEAKLDEELKPLANIQSKAILEAQKKKAEEDLASLYELLPKDKEIDKLLAIFNDTAKESGIKIKEIAPNEQKNNQNNNMQPMPQPPNPNVPQPPQPNGNNDVITRYPIKMVVEGSYSQIGSFLDKILGVSRIIKVENLQLSTNENKKDNNTIVLKAEIFFVTYLQSDIGINIEVKPKTPKASSINNNQQPNTLSAKPNEGGG